MERPVNYKQTDPRWRNIQYSSRGDKNQTIGTSGCGPSCAAMVIATLRNQAVTPASCCQWAQSQGYRTANNGTDFAYFPAQLAEFDIPCRYTWEKAAAEAALRAGRMVIGRALAGLWTSSGHFILAYGIQGDRVLLNDPNSNAESREKAPLATWREEVAPFWIIEEDWRMQIENCEIIVKDENSSRLLTVPGLNVEGHNYIRLRSLGELAPVTVDYDAEVGLPVVTAKDTGSREILKAWLQRQLEALNK